MLAVSCSTDEATTLTFVDISSEAAAMLFMLVDISSAAAATLADWFVVSSAPLASWVAVADSCVDAPASVVASPLI